MQAGVRTVHVLDQVGDIIRRNILGFVAIPAATQICTASWLSAGNTVAQLSVASRTLHELIAVGRTAHFLRQVLPGAITRYPAASNAGIYSCQVGVRDERAELLHERRPEWLVYRHSRPSTGRATREGLPGVAIGASCWESRATEPQSRRWA